MKVWFEEDPDRLTRELEALRGADVEVKIDEELKAQRILRLLLTIKGTNPYFDLPDSTKSLQLGVVFPFLYPYFRPIVFAYNFSLPRHYNPVGKNLCLLGRNTDEWEPQTTLASHLQSQLKKVLLQGNITNPDILSSDPLEQAEPETDYYVTLPGKVLFDPTVYESIPTVDKPIQNLGKIRVGFSGERLDRIRLAVLESRGANGQILGRLPDPVHREFATSIPGTVYRLSSAPPYNANEAFEEIKEKLLVINEKIQFQGADRKLPDGNSIKYIYALNFPEESTHFNKEYKGWLLLLMLRVKQPLSGRPQQWAFHNVALFAKISRIDKESVSVRIPKLKPLASKTVAVFGLGALGAPSAIEFARNGVRELRLLDFDDVEGATTVRWPLGLSASGKLKTEALKEFIEANYPFTQVVIHTLKLGDIQVWGKGEPLLTPEQEANALEGMLADASLLYDASAEYGIMHFLSQQARFQNIPYVAISATEGAMGGVVMRVAPGKTEGCWMCYLWHKFDGQIPDPPAGNSGRIQPIGCGDLSFTGAGFDLQNISLAGVRLAVSTLCEGEADAYPSFDWDVGVLHLVDSHGQPVLPKWEQLPLKKHPNCPYCHSGE